MCVAVVIAMLVTAAGFAVASIAQANVVVLLALGAAWIGQLSCLPVVHNGCRATNSSTTLMSLVRATEGPETAMARSCERTIADFAS